MEARYIAKNIIPYFEKVRGHCDALEARIAMLSGHCQSTRHVIYSYQIDAALFS